MEVTELSVRPQVPESPLFASGSTRDRREGRAAAERTQFTVLQHQRAPQSKANSERHRDEKGEEEDPDAVEEREDVEGFAVELGEGSAVVSGELARSRGREGRGKEGGERNKRTRT